MARPQSVTTALLISAAAAAGCILYLRSVLQRERIVSLDELRQAVSSASVLQYVRNLEHIVSIEKPGKSEAQITELPIKQLLQLPQLLEVGFPGHHIAQLQPQVCQLASLRCLDLSGNKLTALPAEIASLSSLEDLNLGGNCIVSLPSQIGSLQRLRYLNLMANHLVSVPPEISQLSALCRLGLKGNQLTHLPDNFGSLSGLVELFITGARKVAKLLSSGRAFSLY